MKEKKELGKVLKMEEVVIPAFSVFKAIGYVNHTGAEWKGENLLWYPACVIPDGGSRKDVVVFLYS